MTNTLHLKSFIAGLSALLVCACVWVLEKVRDLLRAILDAWRPA